MSGRCTFLGRSKPSVANAVLDFEVGERSIEPSAEQTFTAFPECPFQGQNTQNPNSCLSRIRGTVYVGGQARVSATPATIATAPASFSAPTASPYPAHANSSPATGTMFE